MFVPSNFKKGTVLARTFPKQLEKLGKTSATVIHNRIAIVEAALEGTWIGDYEKDSEGHEEFKNLRLEIYEVTQDA